MGFAHLPKGTGSLEEKTLIVMFNMLVFKAAFLEITPGEVASVPSFLTTLHTSEICIDLTADTHHTEITLPVDARIRFCLKVCDLACDLEKSKYEVAV